MTLTQITEKGIKDGEIVNADINASAAIAGSKIASDFGSQNVTTTGNLGGKNLNLVHTAPTISLTDSNADDDFDIKVDGGLFKIIDATNTVNRLEIGSDGKFRVGCTAQPSSSVGGFQLDMGSYPGSARISSGAGTSGTLSGSLQIAGSNYHANLANGSNSGAALNLINYNSTDGNSTSVSFHNTNSLGIARILGHNESHSNRLGNLVFMTSDGSFPVETMRLTHDGKLGIWTVDPSASLDVELGSTGTIAQFRGADTDILNIDGDSNQVTLDARNVGALGFEMQGTEAMRIDSSANVSIGNIAPTARFHTSAPYNVTGAKITGGAANYSNALEVANAGGTNLLTVKGDGDVGIGTSSPTVRCNIVDSDSTAWGVGSNLSTALKVENSSGTDGVAAGIQLRTLNNAGAAGIQYIHCVNSSSNYDSDLVFSRRLHPSANYAESLRIQNGGGISFNGDTAAANALDDYEEGTWTPFVGTQSGSNYTIGTSYNCYTKIGNIVHAYFSYQFTAEGNGTITLFNLPFTADSSTVMVGQGYVTGGNNRLSIQYIKYNTTLLLPRVDKGSGYTNYWSSRSEWSATNTFVCWITYKAA